MVRLLVLSISFLFCTNALAAECGLFRVVKGKVTYKKKNKKKFRKARINKKVCQGDTVRTSQDSRAKIVMADDNELNISPSSELLITVYKNGKNGQGKVLLDVVYGKVRSNVKQKYKDNKRSHYRVKTKSAVAGVRGTEFMASYNLNTNESKVVTFEGEVMVGQMKGGQFVPQVSVKPGQFTSNSPGSNPHPAKEVPPQEFAQMDQDSNVSDSPRDVAGDSKPQKPEKEAKKEPQKDKKAEPKAKEPENKELKKQPKADQKNDQAKKAPQGDKAGANKGIRPKGPRGPGAPGVSADGPDAGADNLFGDAPSDAEPGQRDIASIDPASDPLGLPPPKLEELPMGNDTAFEPPKIPHINPIIENLPECTTCNDAVLTKKANVTINIIPPGGSAGGN